MMHHTGLIFDMDGVLVDTLDALYQIYHGILAGYGIAGTREEFNELNGPSMDEVIAILCARHNKLNNRKSLALEFKQAQSRLYQTAELVPYAKSLIQKLHSQGASLALASASHKDNITLILDRFNLSPYFEFIIAGNEVTHAKPDPELYQRATLALNKKYTYAIDDSAHGITSALAAGVSAIQFNRDNPKIHPAAAYQVSSLAEVENLLLQECQILSKFNDYSLIPCHFDLSQFQTEIDQYWLNHKLSTMFDGNALLCLGFSGNKVNVFQDKYRTVFYLLHNPNSDLASYLFSFGVSGYITDINQDILLAQRSNKVSQYAGFYECPPSGSIESADKPAEYINHLLTELSEEVNIDKSKVINVSPVALIKDKTSGQLDILCHIKLNSAFSHSTEDNQEYKNFIILALSQLNNFINKHNSLPECQLITELTSKQ